MGDSDCRSGGEIRGVTVAENDVFITGSTSIPVRKNASRTDTLVARLTSDGAIKWSETFVDREGQDIQVFAPSGSPASIYIGGYASTPFVAKLTESVAVSRDPTGRL